MAVSLLISASGSGFAAIVASTTKVLQQRFSTRPNVLPDKPLPVYRGVNPSRDPVTRGGLWSKQHLRNRQLIAMSEGIEPFLMASAGESGGSQSEDGPGGGSLPGEENAPIGSPGGPGGSTPPSPSQLNTNTGNLNTPLPLVDWPFRGDISVSFDLYHNSLSSYKFDLGYGWSHSYDVTVLYTPGTAIIRYGDGTELPYSETAGSFTPPAGFYDALVRNANETWKVTTKKQWVLDFNTAGKLVSVKDRAGNQVTISRNASNKITQISDGASRTLSFAYDTDGRIASVTDPAGRTWTFSYDTYSDLRTVTYPLSLTRTYSYDSKHNIVQTTDRRGKQWQFSYDAQERLSSANDPLLRTTSYSYSNTAVTITNPLNGTIVHNYSNGLIASIVDEAGYSASFNYNANRHITSYTSKRGKTWTFAYDSKGNTISRTNPLSQTHTYTYNSTNDLTSETNPLGQTKTYTIDSNGNVTAVINAASVVQAGFSYDQYGQMVTKSDALGRTSVVAYDTYGNETSVTSPSGATASHTYDIIGRRLSTVEADSGTTTIQYDSLSRISSITLEGNRTSLFTYDGEGNIVTATDALGRSQTRTYDAKGNLTQIVNAKGDTETYTYDALDRLIHHINGRGMVRTHAYSVRGDMSSITLPDGTVESWSYDASGNVLSRTNGLGQTIAYVYDDAGRETKVDYPTGVDTIYNYDSAGRVSGFTDATGSTSIQYNSVGLAVQLNQPQGSLSYTYNAAGERTSMSRTGVGTTVFSYDQFGRLASTTSAAGETTSWSYDTADRVASETKHNGTVTLYGYDSSGRTTTITHKRSDNSVISSETYTFDAVDNLAAKVVNGVTTTYSYDQINQLVGEFWPGQTVAYAYDQNGNRTSKSVNGNYEYYTYDSADKLLTAGSKSYTYDLAGRTTSVTVSGVTTSISYDYEDRITSIARPGMTTNTFQYNALSARVGMTDSQGQRTFLRDGVMPSAPVLSDGVREFTPTVSETKTSGTLYSLTNQIGTVTHQVNGLEQVVSARSYDAFGMLVSATGTTDTPFGFAGTFGYQEDGDTGLKLLGHRYYDASTGRFLTKDPIKDGRNWYTYAENNPLRYIDPDGLEAVGHHIIPKEVWSKGGLPKEAADLFDSATTGEIPGGHGWSKEHAEYNKAVKEEFEKFCKEKGIDPKKMTAKQAKEFLERILNSKDARIAGFLKKIYDKLGKKVPKTLEEMGERVIKKIGKKLGKKLAGAILRKVPIVGWLIFGYDLITGGPGHAFNELVWPASELWNKGG